MGDSNDNNISEMYDVLFVLQVMTRQIALSEYKGYFVLMGDTAFMPMLNEKNLDTYMRSTHDIDLYVSSESAWQSFKRDIVQILNSNQDGVQYQITNFKKRSTTSDSINLIASYKGTEYRLKIDRNVSLFKTITVTYLSSAGMNAYDCDTMIVDKVSAICSQKVYRQSKDLYDLYVLSQIRQYSLNSLVNYIKVKRPEFFTSGVNMLVPQNYASLEHAYSKYRGLLNKPEFDAMFKICSSFICPFFSLDTINRDLYWNGEYWI